MKKAIIVAITLLQYNLFAQAQIGVQQTIEIEVSGRPTWQKIIPLGKNGLIFFMSDH